MTRRFSPRTPAFQLSQQIQELEGNRFADYLVERHVEQLADLSGARTRLRDGLAIFKFRHRPTRAQLHAH